MKGDIYLNIKEARRIETMEKLVSGKITIPQAAQVLNLSDRQAQRLKRRFVEEGEAALAHKNRGRTPKHALPETTRHAVVQLAISEFRGTSCEHVAELLDEFHQIRLSAKTVGRILKRAGIFLRFTRKQSRLRRSRERMPQAGLLVQCDASPYAWLEERGNLHGCIDDATGKVTGLRFEPQECLEGYLHALDQTVRLHGIPCSLYSDRHTIFFSPKTRKLTLDQELAGIQVLLMCLSTENEAI